MPTGTLEIEVPEVGIVEFPADTKQEDIEAILNRTYGPKATPQVPEFKSPIELPPVKPGEKSVYEEPTWMDEPTVKLGDFLIKGPHEAKSPTEEGINKTLREGINSLTSPRNLLYMLGSMGVAATGQAAKALVGALWTGAMGANAIQNAPQLYARMGEEMAKPPEERDKELLGELGTQAFIDTGFFVAPALGLKSALTETPKLTVKPEVSNAVPIESPNAEVLREQRPEVGLPQVGARNIEPEEAARAQAEAPKNQVALSPEQQAAEQARLAKELGQEEQPAAATEAAPVQEPKAGAAGSPEQGSYVEWVDQKGETQRGWVAGIYKAKGYPGVSVGGYDYAEITMDTGPRGASTQVPLESLKAIPEPSPQASPEAKPPTEPIKAPVGVPQEAKTEPVPEPTKPVEPPDSRTVLGTADDIRISAPEGATQIRVTTPDGKHSVQSIADLKKGNTFKGADIAKVEAGTIGRDGKFKAMEGDVIVAGKEIIEPSKDPIIGKNRAGEVIHQRADGSVYRIRMDRKDRPSGYPDFGGDLAPVEPPLITPQELERVTSQTAPPSETVAKMEAEEAAYKGRPRKQTGAELQKEYEARQKQQLSGPGTPAAAQPPATSFEKAQTGKSFSMRLLRGQGAEASPYSEFVPQEAILGKGRWTTPSREYAETFGKNITEHDVHLENPLVIRTDDQWRPLIKEAGWKYANPFGQDIEVTRKNIRDIRALLESKGYDGVIIDPSTEGDMAKTLWNVFGEKQVVEFNPKTSQDLGGPGTPAASQPPDPKAAIEALEESFRNIRGPRPTLAEQVRKAFSVGEKAARAKDAVSSAVQGLKSSGDYLINKWKGEPKLDNMLRAKGELSAELEARGWRVRKFVKTVEKAMPTQRQRAAVLKWVDAGGDPAELQRGLDQTKPEFKQAYQDALNLKGDDLIAAQNIRSYFDERLQDAMDAGVLQQGVEDYIHRLYERDPKTQKQALAYVQSGLLQQNPALVKKRVFQFDWEAERAGRRPIQDFLPRIANYESSLSRAIAAREFVRKMVGYEEGNKRIPGMKAPDGRPVIDVAGLGVPVEDAAGVREATLIKPSFKPGDEADPKNNRRDYVERDYPALRKWRWTTLDAGGKPIFVQGNLLIHPDFVGRVDALLEPSRVKYGRYPKLGRAALGASSTVKQTMLDLSGFHQVQITVHGMEHKVMPWRIVKDIDFQNPNMDGLLKGGLTLGGEYYSAHHGEGLVGSALTRHIPILGPLMESYHNWLFQSYIPRIKTTMAMAALERNRARYKGQLTEEQIYTKTANEANSAFGELNYIMLERSKTTQDIARLVMLAPDFLEARGRFAGGALEKGGKLGGHEQRAALLLGALTMYITARIANKLTDDKYHFEPENAFSLVHNGHAYSLRTVQGDILHLLEQPLQFWMNRLNPVFGRTLLQLTTGRDYFGRKRTVAETLWDTVKNTVPIALRSSQERKLWESMMNSMGVTARRWNDVDKAFTLAKDWKKQHGVTEPGEFIYDPEKDPLRGLKIALSRSDDIGAAQEIRKVLASKVYTREKLNAYFDRYAKMPFTGSAANDRKWMATLTDDQRKIVEGARQHKIALRNMYRQSRAKFDDLMKTPLP